MIQCKNTFRKSNVHFLQDSIHFRTAATATGVLPTALSCHTNTHTRTTHRKVSFDCTEVNDCVRCEATVRLLMQPLTPECGVAENRARLDTDSKRTRAAQSNNETTPKPSIGSSLTVFQVRLINVIEHSVCLNHLSTGNVRV